MRLKHLGRLVLPALLILLCWTNLTHAFDYGLTILNKDQIHQLSDEALKQAYVDVLIEIEAAKVFHIKAGFTPRDYQQFKDLIRYRVNLFFELQSRKLAAPNIGQETER